MRGDTRNPRNLKHLRESASGTGGEGMTRRAGAHDPVAPRFGGR
jgi:hypothetical protein